MHLHDDFPFHLLMFLGHSRVIGLSSWNAIACSMAEQLLDGILVKQFINGVLIQAPTHSAQDVGDFIV